MKAPKTREECIDGIRPCPWIRCKHHNLWFYAYEKDPTKLGAWLSRKSDDDIVDDCQCTLETIGNVFGVTRERIRQIENFRLGGAIRRFGHHARRHFLEDFRGMA